MWWIAIIIVVVVLMISGGAITKRRSGIKGKSKRPNNNNNRANFGGQSNGANNKELFERQKKIWFANINHNAKVNNDLYEKIDMFPFFSSFSQTKQYLTNKTSSMTKAKDSSVQLDILNNQFYSALTNAETALLGNFNDLGLGNDMQTTIFAIEVYQTFLNEGLPLTLNLLYAQGAQNFIDYCNGKIDKPDLLSKNSKLVSQYSGLLMQLVNDLIQQVYQTFNRGYQSFDQQDWGDEQSNYYEQGSYEETSSDDELTLAYQTLGVDINSSDAEIKAAYKKLAIKYHPDKNKTPEAAEMMTKVNAAYTLIKKTRQM